MIIKIVVRDEVLTNNKLVQRAKIRTFEDSIESEAFTFRTLGEFIHNEINRGCKEITITEKTGEVKKNG